MTEPETVVSKLLDRVYVIYFTRHLTYFLILEIKSIIVYQNEYLWCGTSHNFWYWIWNPLPYTTLTWTYLTYVIAGMAQNSKILTNIKITQRNASLKYSRWYTFLINMLICKIVWHWLLKCVSGKSYRISNKKYILFAILYVIHEVVYYRLIHQLLEEFAKKCSFPFYHDQVENMNGKPLLRIGIYML